MSSGKNPKVNFANDPQVVAARAQVMATWMAASKREQQQKDQQAQAKAEAAAPQLEPREALALIVATAAAAAGSGSSSEGGGNNSSAITTKDFGLVDYRTRGTVLINSAGNVVSTARETLSMAATLPSRTLALAEVQPTREKLQLRELVNNTKLMQGAEALVLSKELKGTTPEPIMPGMWLPRWYPPVTGTATAQSPLYTGAAVAAASATGAASKKTSGGGVGGAEPPLFYRKFVPWAELFPGRSVGIEGRCTPADRPLAKVIQLTLARHSARLQPASTGISRPRAFLFPGTPPWVLDPAGFLQMSGVLDGGGKNAAYGKAVLAYLRETGMQQRHLDLRWDYFWQHVVPEKEEATAPMAPAAGLVLRSAIHSGGAEFFSSYEIWSELLGRAGLALAPAEEVLAKAGQIEQQQQQSKQNDDGSADEVANAAVAAASGSTSLLSDNDRAVVDAFTRKREFSIDSLFALGLVRLDPRFDDNNLVCVSRCARCRMLLDMELPPECLCGAVYCSMGCWERHREQHRAACELRLENQVLNVVLSENCARLIQDGSICGDFYRK